RPRQYCGIYSDNPLVCFFRQKLGPQRTSHILFKFSSPFFEFFADVDRIPIFLFWVFRSKDIISDLMEEKLRPISSLSLILQAHSCANVSFVKLGIFCLYALYPETMPLITSR